MQVDTFWYEVCQALREPIDAGIFRKDETRHIIERAGTKQRIRAKTCWNANTLRGDFAADLYLDEFQLMAEDKWEEVGAPTLLDNNGDPVLIFTPPSLHSSGVSKARDPRHASKLFTRAQDGELGPWEAIHFSSHANPFISSEALGLLTQDMSLDSYRREIEAIDEEIEQQWLVYGMFNEQVCKIRRFDIPKHWLHYSGHDFGSANPAALFLSQNPGPEEPKSNKGASIRKGDWVIWAEYMPGAGLSVADHVARFKEIAYNKIITRSVGGNVHGEDEIRQAYSAHGWPIQAPKLDKIGPQIDRVIGLHRLGKIHIFDDLHNLLYQMANCLWVIDKDDNRPTSKVDNDARWHLLAAKRYILSDFTPETVRMDAIIVKSTKIKH